jgi:membrane protein insertase Oxa1/YidC/SpoIIIJ
MSRPEHLSCVNTAGGIERINKMQEIYDKDPEEWERREQQQKQQQEMEEEQRKEDERNWQELRQLEGEN